MLSALTQHPLLKSFRGQCHLRLVRRDSRRDVPNNDTHGQYQSVTATKIAALGITSLTLQGLLECLPSQTEKMLVLEIISIHEPTRL